MVRDIAMLLVPACHVKEFKVLKTSLFIYLLKPNPD